MNSISNSIYNGNNRNKEFLDFLASSLINMPLSDIPPGLLTGKAGISLFLFYHSKHAQNDLFSKKATCILETIFEDLSDGYHLPTFCDGLAGIGWMLEHITQKKFIDRKSVKILDDFDVILYKKMMSMVKIDNLDYLHGAIGIALYFIERIDNKDCLLYLLEFIEELDKKSIKSNNNIYWNSTDQNNVSFCNLGLAHGIPSIIIFLAKMHSIKKDSIKIKKMLDGVISYLLSHKQDPLMSNYYFPNIIANNIAYSKERKIAWCYGDMGRCLALYSAGESIQNSELKNLALEIILNLTKNRDDIDEPGFCHGTIGVSYIFRRMYNVSNIKSLQKASLFWLDKTFLFKNNENEFAFPKDFQQHNKLSLITGVVGIGLALMSFEYNENDWDKCLLIS